MIPDLPEGWQSALAAAGSILVVVLLLRWTRALVDRVFDVVDRVVADAGHEGDEAP